MTARSGVRRGPEKGSFVFRRAMAHAGHALALAAARDLPQVSLVDTLELAVFVARKDPRLPCQPSQTHLTALGLRR